MLKMKPSFFLLISLGLANLVNTKRHWPNRVVVVTNPKFQEYGDLGLDEVTIATPSLKSQIG